MGPLSRGFSAVVISISRSGVVVVVVRREEEYFVKEERRTGSERVCVSVWVARVKDVGCCGWVSGRLD